MRHLLFIILLALPHFTFAKANEHPPITIEQDHVKVRLIAPAADFTAPFQLGVHFQLDPHWHIYWRNPGDSGATPKFKLTDGEIQKIHWPYPTRLPVGELTNYGYEHEVVIPLDVTGNLPLKLNLEWLVCKVECIPGFAEFEVTPENITVDKVLFQKFVDLVPTDNSKWQPEFIKLANQALEFKFHLSQINLADLKNVFIFPENGENFLTTTPVVEALEDSLKISVPVSNNAQFSGATETMTFVVQKTDNSVFAFTKRIPVREAASSLALALLLAFLGGVILNLMPCVFPVLFLKLFSFLKEKNRQAVRNSSWQYSAGVVTSFIVVGGALSLLRYSGEAIGWGYQLQSFWMVYLLSLLFFIMGLNFFGFFDFGNLIASRASQVGSQKFFSGSFGTGILAVIVASPCTAPFMGSALGLSILLPAHLSILIFIALGVGMALPMLILAYIPHWIEKIPRSGSWMITVKQFMSFPLFGSCIWLLWVLGAQKGLDAVILALVSFLLGTWAIWLLNITTKNWLKLASTLTILALPILTVSQIAKHSPVAQKESVDHLWQVYSPDIVDAIKMSQPIFIDFTAAWCITCQVNKKTVLHTPEILDLFAQHNVLLLKADWTNHNPVITNALAQFGRNSVPLYVFYNKLSEPKVLPEILTKDLIRELFKKE